MLPTHPTVTPSHHPDTGTTYAVTLGPYRGEERGLRRAAEADTAALAEALGPLLAVAERCHALLADPAAFGAGGGRHAAPTSAALRVLRWVVEGPEAPEGDGLDRVAVDGGMVTAGEEE